MELDDLIQLTPINSIKKNRKRCIKERMKKVQEDEIEEEENIIDLKSKTYETIGIFFFEKQTFIMQNNKRILLGMTLREKNQLQELVNSQFFNNENMQIIIDLNNEKSKTPRLRAYDWAVTNFSKTKRSCVYEKDANANETTLFDPYSLYVGELKKFHRLLFDPFRRGTHVYFEFNNAIQVSTVGQLTFIKWCIENKIDKYVEENYVDIKKNMTQMSKKRKLEKEKGSDKQKKHHFIKNKNILKTGYYEELEI